METQGRIDFFLLDRKEGLDMQRREAKGGRRKMRYENQTLRSKHFAVCLRQGKSRKGRSVWSKIRRVKSPGLDGKGREGTDGGVLWIFGFSSIYNDYRSALNNIQDRLIISRRGD